MIPQMNRLMTTAKTRNLFRRESSMIFCTMSYSFGLIKVPSFSNFSWYGVIFCLRSGMPHFGQTAEWSLITSLCIVHVYISLFGRGVRARVVCCFSFVLFSFEELLQAIKPAVKPVPRSINHKVLFII